MNNKYAIPVYVLVVALVIFLMWFFLKPPAAPENNANNPCTAKTPPARPDDSWQRKPFVPPTGRGDQFSSIRVPDGPPLNPKEPMRRTTIGGRVIDHNGEGIKDARVLFVGAGEYTGFRGSGYSQPDGRYRFLIWEMVPNPSRARTTAGGRVHASTPDGRDAISDNLDFGLTGEVSMPDVKLEPVGTLTGRVLGADGEPAAGAPVRIKSKHPLHRANFVTDPPVITMHQFSRGAECDRNGNFEFPNLPVADYYIYVDICYYGYQVEPVEVKVTAGAPVWQNVKLLASDWIRGTVVDSQARPVPGVIVRLVGPTHTPSVAGDNIMSRGGGGGPGGFSQPPKDGPRPRPARGPDKGAGPRDAGGRPGRNPGETRRPGPESQPARPAPEPELNSVTTITNELGQFGFMQVIEGDYRLEVMVGENDGVQLQNVHINEVNDYRMQVSGKNSLEGIVRDAETGQLITRYDVRQVPFGTSIPKGDEPATPFDRFNPDTILGWHDNGRFMMISLDRKVRIRICAPGYAAVTDFIDDIKDGETRAGVEYRLNPLCETTLTIREDGKGLALEPVLIFYGTGFAYQASTDELGQARIVGVLPGDYSLRIQRADGSMLSGKFTVPPKSRAAVEVAVSKG